MVHTAGDGPDTRRAQTIRELLDAAAVVFARHGYHGTSVDQVAEAAGYTKGAVYSNFSSKQDMFLALMDAHLDQAIDVLEETLSEAAPQNRAALVGQRRDKMVVFDQQWHMLETEFVLYAARNERVRERMAVRQQRTRERIAGLVERHLADVGASTTVDVRDVAALLVAAGDGLTVMGMIDPDTADPARLLTLLVDLLLRASAAPSP